MAIELTNPTKFDTRGLPVGYDPHKFYEYRYETLVQDATGIERFAYKYMPFTLLKSFAFAIDPLAKFKVSSHPITPSNRDRYRTVASVLQQRFQSRTRNRTTYTTAPNYRNVQFCDSPFYYFTTLPSNPSVTALPSQDSLADYSNDTTSRTRLFGSEQGELELFKSKLFSPPRKIRNGVVDKAYYNPGSPSPECAAVGGTRMQHNGGWDYYQDEHYPTGATLSKGTLTSLRNSEIAYCKALAQKQAIPLLSSWSPNSRDYTLFRNVVELKDLPRSIRSLANTLDRARQLYVSLQHSPKVRKVIFDLKASAKDIPGEYVSFHFGWKQTYKDLVELMDLPTKLTKKYQFLIKRNGRPTTFRSKRVIPSAVSGVSGFSYNVTSLEHTVTSQSRIERESEVRLVINAVFDFPPINDIHFNSLQFWERIGAVPRPTDLYNLIPWTWLVDWCTGLGNYVQLVDETNRDPSLINWGMITCRTTGKLVTDYSSKSTMTANTYNNPGTIVSTSFVDNKHTSVLEFECQTRSDVAAILGVKTTSVPSSLTTYQKSILGSLLLQRTKLSRFKGS